MAGLVSYASSDEEDSIDEGRRMQVELQVRTPLQLELSVLREQGPPNNRRRESVTALAENEHSLHSAGLNGAILGPLPQTIAPESNALSAPTSPYAIHRETIRSLTLPTKPNFDIPQSPLGSPTPGADQKFSHFLELKKHGVDFNTKLATSSALKNPSLLPKLMDFAGVGSEWQYTTTMPTELWDPAGFPTWAYKEELAEAQHSLSKKKEEERTRIQRESIDFAAAGSPGQPSGLAVLKGIRPSAAERVMAGLGKVRKPSPQRRGAK